MKKTYVTSMPNHIGAFLKASKCFSSLGINITRVSYNKAVDSHTLFIDAEGTEEQLKKADAELEQIGYLQNNSNNTSVVLIEFCLKDVPGSVTSVLTLINDFNFNISYISSQENGTDYQQFKMGLYVEDFEKIKEFLKEAEKLCKIRVIDYNSSEKVYDNSIFYNTYVMGLSQTMGLSKDISRELLVHVNLAMQTLDEQGLSPYRTFDSISKFAELLGASKGREFMPRISTHKVSENTEITLIEPPCGSNTIIVKSNDRVLFVDSGYACYSDEMLEVFKKILPDFEELHFEVYEGKGGHLPGEIVLIDYTHHLAITGDIYINTHGLTPEQAEYNQYAPILMTSVDAEPKLCAEERRAIMQRLGVGQWQIFGAHGFKKDYSVTG